MLFAKLEEYRAWCDATDKTGTEFVKQARFWLSPSEEAWKQDYNVADPKLTAAERALERAVWPEDAP